MRPLFLATLAGVLAGCTPTEPGPVAEYSDAYYQNTTICVYRFQDRKHLKPSESCADGQERVAVGYSVQPVKGECEPAFMSLNGLRQIWGCEP